MKRTEYINLGNTSEYKTCTRTEYTNLGNTSECKTRTRTEDTNLGNTSECKTRTHTYTHTHVTQTSKEVTTCWLSKISNTEWKRRKKKKNPKKEMTKVTRGHRQVQTGASETAWYRNRKVSKSYLIHMKDHQKKKHVFFIPQTARERMFLFFYYRLEKLFFFILQIARERNFFLNSRPPERETTF